MVRKTKGLEVQVLSILKSSSIPISPAEIAKKILGDDNPQLIPYSQTLGLVRYHLKRLNEQGIVRKEEFKNGFVYSMVGD